MTQYSKVCKAIQVLMMDKSILFRFRPKTKTLFWTAMCRSWKLHDRSILSLNKQGREIDNTYSVAIELKDMSNKYISIDHVGKILDEI
jgi:hypothetical protein